MLTYSPYSRGGSRLILVSDLLFTLLFSKPLLIPLQTHVEPYSTHLLNAHQIKKNSESDQDRKLRVRVQYKGPVRFPSKSHFNIHRAAKA